MTIKIKMRFLPIIICLGVSLLWSCDSKQQFEAAYFALIDDTKGMFAKEMAISPDGGVRTLTLVSNREWTIDCQQTPWISISPLSGNGPATISFTVEPNETVGEDSVKLDIINNSLTVIDDFVVIRQDYQGEYKGESTVVSPIEYISSTVSSNDILSTIAASLNIETVGSVITMVFHTTLKTSSSTYYSVEFPIEVNRSTISENGNNSFIFEGEGSYDMSGLGLSLNDPSITGIKKTIVSASLSKNIMKATVMIDPGTGNVAEANKTTVFEVTCSR